MFTFESFVLPDFSFAIPSERLQKTKKYVGFFLMAHLSCTQIDFEHFNYSKHLPIKWSSMNVEKSFTVILDRMLSCRFDEWYWEANGLNPFCYRSLLQWFELTCWHRKKEDRISACWTKKQQSIWCNGRTNRFLVTPATIKASVYHL